MYMWEGLKNIRPFKPSASDDIAIKSISLSRYYSHEAHSQYADPEDKLQNVQCSDDAGTHGVILTEDGQVYTFGDNDSGQLGLGDSDRHGPEPVIVDELKGMVKMGVVVVISSKKQIG